MKRVFLDTNFVIDYLLREDYRADAVDFLSLGTQAGCRFFISFLTVANVAYIARKLPKQLLYDRLISICNLFDVVDNNQRQLEQAILIKADDFEDALQYCTAVDAGCECIITRNKQDFKFSQIEVISAVEYIQKYFRK